MNTTTDFAKYISRFFSEYLPYERNYSSNTIASYRDTFVQFIDYMRKVKNIELGRLTLAFLTKDNIRGFLVYLVDRHSCSQATKNLRLAAFHTFTRYLQYIDIGRLAQWQDVLSIKCVKSQKKEINYFNLDGIKLLLGQPDTSTRNGRRHLAILSLMYDTGARVQEIADLTVDSVRVDSEPYTIKIAGKGHKIRIVPLVKEQVAILKEYIRENNLDNSNLFRHPLFFNNRNEKLTRTGITYIFKIYANMARKLNSQLVPDPVSCHSLRHSKAMHLLQAGVNIVIIRDFLGHSSIQTTDIYARADSKAKHEALEKAYVDLIPPVQTEREWEKNKNLRDWLMRLQK